MDPDVAVNQANSDTRSDVHARAAIVGALAPADEEQLRWNTEGLIPAIVQDADNGEVLMMAWMNHETLSLSLREGRTVFWSRSRQEIWRKGDTSGDRQFIRSASYDCDGDTLLFGVDQEGKGACHTGARSCFYRNFTRGPAAAASPTP